MQEKQDYHAHTFIKKRKNFSINTNYLFIYDSYSIKYYSFNGKKLKEMKDKKKIDFSIDNDSKTYQKITNISTGLNPEKIIIVVDASPETDTIYEWDLMHNVEDYSADVGKRYEIIWDNCGNPLVLKPDEAILNGGFISTFDLDEEIIKCPENILKNYAGYRLDGKNWNWFIVK